MIARRTLIASTLALICSTAPVAAENVPGVTADSIKIGQIAPLSGPASALGVTAKAAEAYFRMVNDQGGVNGRKIEAITLDDAYNPARTVEMARRLVEQDQVSLLFLTTGGSPNAAIQTYLNDRKVPQLLVSTGGDRFNNPGQFPWTSRFSPSYRTEAQIYANYILKETPDAKIAVLYQNDDLGKDYLDGLRDVLGEKYNTMVVGTASYEAADPSVDSQVIRLKSTGADVLVAAATPRIVPQAIRRARDIGWTAPIYIVPTVASIRTLEPAGLERAAGVMSGAFMKDPGDPAWAEDADVKAYLEWQKAYLPDADPTDALIVFAYNAANMLVHILESAGDDLSRENIMRAHSSVSGLQLPLFLPGLTVSMTAQDYTTVSSLQMIRFNGKSWETLGGLVSR